MAFDINAAGGFANGSSNLTASNGATLNHYARITACTASTITIADKTADFLNGEEILVHVSTGTADKLGRWQICYITAVNDNTLTVNADLTSLLDLTNNSAQIVSIPHYKDVTIPADVSISPPAFDAAKLIGGIFIIKCSGTLTLKGKIDLADKGIPTANAALRSLLTYESTMTLDTDTYSGYENATAYDRLPLNVGDGTAFIFATKITCSGNPRIGNPNTQGVCYCRGASDSANCPAGVTNVGGSNILIVANTLQSFQYAAIAKYRSGSAGKGICRCAIASNTLLPVDEALYSYNVISDPSRLKANCNFTTYGAGTKNKVNPASDVNQYARVTSINGQILEYDNKTTDSSFKGSCVLIHFFNKTIYNLYSGRIWLAKVVDDDGYRLTLDSAPPADNISLTAAYGCQVVLIPQYASFTLNQTYNKTKAFDGRSGGIFAIMVKGTCDLSDGVIDMKSKGGSKEVRSGVTTGAPYNIDNKSMTFGNAHIHSRLPLGEGYGSIFIIAKTLKLNENSRLGSTFTGNAFGGTNGNGQTGGWKGIGGDLAGSGAGGGHIVDFANGYGGYGCSGYHYDGNNKRLVDGQQGAHLFIIANTIDGLSLANIATGGVAEFDKYPGGAGFGSGVDNWGNTPGGSGGFIGGGVDPTGADGGGSGGFAFFYTNNVSNLNSTNL